MGQFQLNVSPLPAIVHPQGEAFQENTPLTDSKSIAIAAEYFTKFQG